eukprot:c34455_g1_i1.p1 GENE.c34455_g1_i1~~c34455_g1_i1.p1  ORF type:complete len:203 (-),score=39.43 c34455_g1_i1:26-607(-)
MAAASRTLTFVTGNANKLRETAALLGDVFALTSAKVDLDELQGEPADVAVSKCRAAALVVQGPVICEDTSLSFNALHGLPGVYIKWFLDKLGHEGLNNMLAAYDDKSANARCIFTYCEGPGGEVKLFEGICPGRIVPARGPPDFGWDPVFLPDGFDQTFAEMDKATKASISHRGRALEKLKAYLLTTPHAPRP